MGTPLGRPAEDEKAVLRQQAREDEKIRNQIEGKFGQSKRREAPLSGDGQASLHCLHCRGDFLLGDESGVPAPSGLLVSFLSCFSMARRGSVVHPERMATP